MSISRILIELFCYIFCIHMYMYIFSFKIRERNGLKQQCTAAIRQWDLALRERNDYRDALGKVSSQHEEAVREMNQAMGVRVKATKDMKRLTEERNAAMQEITLIMSERFAFLYSKLKYIYLIIKMYSKKVRELLY